MENKLFKIFVINYYGDLPKILQDLDIEIPHNNLIFCPMHDNYNTPAAKIFKDSTGWHFYCFNEQKQFGTYDVYKQVYNLNMDYVFQQLWSKLSEEDKAHMFDLFGETDEDSSPENLDLFLGFKSGSLSYTRLLQEISARKN